MRTVLLLGFLGATFAAPLIPQALLSASNSNELLMSLGNARLRTLQQSLQAPTNPLIFPIPGILQQRTQIPGLSQIPWSSPSYLGGLVPNQIPFPGQVKLAQRTRAIHQEPSQLQTLQQNQQEPYQIIPCFFPYGVPQPWGQMVQYYPVCMYGTQDLTLQFFPPQAGQLQPQEQVLPGGQEQMTFDLLRGDAPQTPGMPIENVLPYSQREMNLGYLSDGVFMPTHTSKHQTANILAPSMENNIPLELMEEQINPDILKES